MEIFEILAPLLSVLGLVEPKGEVKQLDELKRKYIPGLSDRHNPGHLRLAHSEMIIEYICELNLDDDIRIADISTGKGHLLKGLDNQGGYSLTGIDVTPPSDEVLDDVEYEFELADLNEDYLQNIPSCKYDLVVSSETIEHLHNPKKFISEITRVAKEDGIIMLTYPNIESIQERLRCFMLGEFRQYSKSHKKDVKKGKAHLSMIHHNVLLNLLSTTNYEVYNEFGDYARFNSIAYRGRRTNHSFSYSKGYDIQKSR